MQKVYFLFVVVCFSLATNAQLVFNENFNGYTNGNLSVAPVGPQGSWVTNDNGDDVQVNSVSPLVYSGYGTGNKYVTVNDVDGRDPHKLFSSSITTSGNRVIYLSFLVEVRYAPELSDLPDYSIALRNTADADVPLRFYVREDATGSDIEFGIGAGNDNNANGSGDVVSYTTGNYNYNTTYLIVIRYDVFSAAGNNDDAYLWVNPALGSTPPTTASAGATRLDVTEESYGSLLNALQIFQSDNTDSPEGDYDGFRVAHGADATAAWSNLNPPQAPLPVEVKSFKALKENNSVKVSWEVGIESNVMGYEIQRSQDGTSFQPIGFVDAAGKSNYTYMDSNPLSGVNLYRVVTIDNDRRLKYSSIVSVNGRSDLYIARFPNPTTTTLIVQHQEVSAPAVLRVTSIDGRAVKLVKLALHSVQTNMDVSNLRTGNYILEFVSGEKRVSTTFIKQ